MLKIVIVVLGRSRVGLGEFYASEDDVMPARSHGPYKFAHAALVPDLHFCSQLVLFCRIGRANHGIKFLNPSSISG
jgi:hypothetical protein